jgi:hypothetical protein
MEQVIVNGSGPVEINPLHRQLRRSYYEMIEIRDYISDRLENSALSPEVRNTYTIYKAVLDNNIKLLDTVAIIFDPKYAG